jgi:hypothetical protein
VQASDPTLRDRRLAGREKSISRMKLWSDSCQYVVRNVEIIPICLERFAIQEFRNRQARSNRPEAQSCREVSPRYLVTGLTQVFSLRVRASPIRLVRDANKRYTRGTRCRQRVDLRNLGRPFQSTCSNRAYIASAHWS